MAVGVSLDRDAFLFTYDVSLVHGDTISARFENQANHDVSVYAGANDGGFVATLPKDRPGPITDLLTVTGSDGGEDSGEVTFG